jgi:hypothetical protein
MGSGSMIYSYIPSFKDWFRHSKVDWGRRGDTDRKDIA